MPQMPKHSTQKVQRSQLFRRYGTQMIASALASTLVPFLIGCNNFGGTGIGLSSQPLTFYWAVTVGDVNGDGKPDIVTSYTYAISQTNLQGFAAVLLQDPANPGKFLPPVKYRVGDHPMALAVADLNGDGKPDIVVLNMSLNGGTGGQGNSVSVLLQNPASPGQFEAAANYETGVSPNAVAIGDLNGDGRPDLAVGDNNGISILFQNPTSPGTFQPLTVLPTSPATSVAIADVNGDNRADIVAANETNVVVFLENAANTGTFSAPASYGAGLQPTWVAVGDLNGDGKPDIAVANQGAISGGNGSVSVLLESSAAPGTFLTNVDYATLHAANLLVISDLNGDGKPDLIAGDLDRVSIFLENPNLPGQFQPAVDYVCSLPVTSLAVADLNGDGKPDLLIADSDGVVILFQDPAKPGQFLPQVIIAD